MNSIQWALTGALLVMFCLVPASAGQPTRPHLAPELILVGGAWHTCASSSPRRCSSGPSIEDGWEGPRYLIDAAAKRRLAKALPDRQSVIAALPHSDAPMTRAELRLAAGLDSSAGDGARLTRAERDRLFDLLETPRSESETAYPLETATPAGREIWQLVASRLEARAENEQQPLVLVTTSASRDPYDAVDFYVSAFESLGAKAIWLPVSAPFSAAVTAGDCDAISEQQASLLGSHDRARVHPLKAADERAWCADPKRIDDLLERADAIFFNGGNQWWTWQAWLGPSAPSRWADIVQRRAAAGALLVIGTSAGTAVQSRPMVTGGEAEVAALLPVSEQPPVDDDCAEFRQCPPDHPARALSWWPDGGFGLVDGLVFDTHFGERNRELRMLSLVQRTPVDIAVGVDETTALHWHGSSTQARIHVVGQRGVTWLQAREDSDWVTMALLPAGSQAKWSDERLHEIHWGGGDMPSKPGTIQEAIQQWLAGNREPRAHFDTNLGAVQARWRREPGFARSGNQPIAGFTGLGVDLETP